MVNRSDLTRISVNPLPSGGGAGAPETLTFNNGDELILLAINMLNHLENEDEEVFNAVFDWRWTVS